MSEGAVPDAEALRAVLERFAIDGELLGVEPLGRGHIHDTYVSSWRGVSDGRAGGEERRYAHQRLNESVFRDVELLMRNVRRVTEHLRAKASPSSLQPLELVPARAGGDLVRDADAPWRTFVFVEGTESFDRCSGPEQAYAAARAFGAFQADLADLAPDALGETLPGFFSSTLRYRQLEEALAGATPERAASAADEVAFCRARADQVGVIEERLAVGAIPRRVVHGDTKLNNVLFDRETGAPRAVVDLDTCMPGYSLYDFGDLVRFTAATSEEDERDLSRAGTDLELYRALADGWLSSAGAFLTDEEVERMPFAARLVTLTIGLRFLADHLAGDVYFKVARPGHNLDRARVQLAMVRFMERHADEMAVRRAPR